eukprot:216127-Prymnesium_polylepis.2
MCDEPMRHTEAHAHHARLLASENNLTHRWLAWTLVAIERYHAASVSCARAAGSPRCTTGSIRPARRRACAHPAVSGRQARPRQPRAARPTRDHEEAHAAQRSPPGSESTPPPKVINMRSRELRMRAMCDAEIRSSERGASAVAQRISPSDMALRPGAGEHCT